MRSTSTAIRTDPLTFETLRHRITKIADEASSVLSMVSSSPVASEVNDCNVAIMDSNGAAVAIGPGIGSHGIGCMMTTRYVRAEYADNPGIRDGDMFLANDPYRCTSHQTCFALVAPVFAAGRIVAWVGAGVHVPDAGGPVPGQVSLGAQSIYQEATPMLPIRIVERGRMRKDLESEYVIRSRTPQQLSLDLRAQIAACDRLTSRLREMFARYSPEVVARAFEDMISFNRAHLAERLRRIPDGEWQASVWLDYPQEHGTDFYECRLVLGKHDDRLILDFRHSSPQAPAVINCGEPGLVSGTVVSLMAMLGYGLPLCPEAVLRTVEIRSRPATWVHASHPAGCSKATTAANHAIVQTVAIATSKMFLSVPGLQTRAIAGSGGFVLVMDVEGTDQRGEQFGTVLLDAGLSGGYGAMVGRDGIDSGGLLGNPLAQIANVETYEARYPMLYLWRRHEVDSGGLGEYRGGRGISLAFTPYRTGEPLGMVFHGHGCAIPSTRGVGGGYPGATNTFEIARDGDVLESVVGDGIPQARSALRGQLEPVEGLYRTQLRHGDVVIAHNNGGGGLGDPLEREPASVLSDVVTGAVSAEWAERGYGVVLRDGDVDLAATREQRSRVRRDRIEQAAANGRVGRAGGGAACPACRDEFGAPLARRRSLSSAGRRVLPFDRLGMFYSQEVVCGRCGRLLDVLVEREDDQAAMDGGGHDEPDRQGAAPHS